MKFNPIHASLYVSRQLMPHDLVLAASTGFRHVICNRPDGENRGQPSAVEIAESAERNGMTFEYLPIAGEIADADVDRMQAVLAAATGPTLAYCRTGSRSARLGALALASSAEPSRLVSAAARAGYDIAPLAERLSSRARRERMPEPDRYDVVIVGGGAAGIATAASILRRRRSVTIAIVDPANSHHYQPGWTMVGAGIFSRASTERLMVDVVPHGATLVRAEVEEFEPSTSLVRLRDGRLLGYEALVVATGLKLDWTAIPGLEDALGRGGVTSNYRADLAPYTARLVKEMKGGRAIFTQPPMPIKCAGAPQKAMYLSCDAWRRAGVLDGIDVAFHTATPALFGVAAYVPALMAYIDRYGVDLSLGSRLISIDGDAGQATFERIGPDGMLERTVEPYDMLHVCPPQVAPPVVASSDLAGPGGFVEVDPATMRHPRFAKVFALGDVAATTNAKTAAAARKQAPVVAENVLATLDGRPLRASYDGYGSCPLTVERGRIVLAEFGYGGTLLPSFPAWLLDGRRPTRLAWFLKRRLMPVLYWYGMLRGREWMASPRLAD